LIKYIAYSTVS